MPESHTEPINDSPQNDALRPRRAFQFAKHATEECRIDYRNTISERCSPLNTIQIIARHKRLLRCLYQIQIWKQGSFAFLATTATRALTLSMLHRIHGSTGGCCIIACGGSPIPRQQVRGGPCLPNHLTGRRTTLGKCILAQSEEPHDQKRQKGNGRGPQTTERTTRKPRRMPVHVVGNNQHDRVSPIGRFTKASPETRDNPLRAILTTQYSSEGAMFCQRFFPKFSRFAV